MFIKKVKKRNGRTKEVYEYLYLVESVRTDKGPRQRLVLNLGTLRIPEETYLKFAKRIEDILTGQAALFKLNDSLEREAKKAAQKIVKKESVDIAAYEASDFQMVDINSMEANNPRSIGAEYIAHSIWQELGIDDFLKGHNITNQIIPIIKALTIGRLVEPGSELFTQSWVENRSALYELTGGPYRTSLNSYYRAGDKLFSLKEELESFLARRERTLFSLSEKIFLLDLTNTYFEGEALSNPKARYGRSKDKRNDCKLVTLGLVIDEGGFIKSSKVFAGNQAEVETLDDMIHKLEKTVSFDNTKDDKRTVVIDAGFASEGNLKFLTENNYDYIAVNRGKAPFEKDFSDMKIIREDKSKGIKIEIKRILKDNEVFILVRSAKKKKKKGKETGIRSRVENLFLERLEYYRNGLSLPRRTKRYRKIVESIGRLKEKYSKASKLYDITIDPEKGKDAADPGIDAIDIRWSKKIPIYDDETNSEGTYILRSSRFDLSDKEIWEIYIMLNRIENAFRCLKSSLGLRPNFHQIEKRVDAHLFISVLAYHILHIAESRLRLAGDNRSWETIRDIMKTHERITISYNAREENGGLKKHFIRLNTTLEVEQLEIYRVLKLSPVPLPKKRVIKERKGVVTTLLENP